MPSPLENTIFKQVNYTLFITSFYIVSLMITSADKGKNEGKENACAPFNHSAITRKISMAN